MKEDDTSVHFNNANVTATDSISRRRSFDKATLPAAHPARVFPLARKPSFSSADSERSFSRPGLQVHSHGRSVRCHDRTRRSEQSSFCIYVAAPIHTYTRHRVHMYSKRSRPSRLVVAQTLMTSLSLIRIPIVAAAVSTGTPLHLLQLLFPSSAVLRAEKKKQIPVEKRGRRSPPSLATRLCPDFSFPPVRCGDFEFPLQTRYTTRDSALSYEFLHAVRSTSNRSRLRSSTGRDGAFERIEHDDLQLISSSHSFKKKHRCRDTLTQLPLIDELPRFRVFTLFRRFKGVYARANTHTRLE